MNNKQWWKIASLEQGVYALNEENQEVILVTTSRKVIPFEDFPNKKGALFHMSNVRNFAMYRCSKDEIIEIINKKYI